MARAGVRAVDDTFGVLSHPVRRTLLERLAGGESRVTELAARLPVSRPAVSQHLRLMLEVGVVTERRQGRERYYRLRRDRLDEVEAWLVQLNEFSISRIRRVGEHRDGQT
jgi:DNA-binding transcriptional ArsR family regulator